MLHASKLTGKNGDTRVNRSAAMITTPTMSPNCYVRIITAEAVWKSCTRPVSPTRRCSHPGTVTGRFPGLSPEICLANDAEPSLVRGASSRRPRIVPTVISRHVQLLSSLRRTSLQVQTPALLSLLNVQTKRSIRTVAFIPASSARSLFTLATAPVMKLWIS